LMIAEDILGYRTCSSYDVAFLPAVSSRCNKPTLKTGYDVKVSKEQRVLCWALKLLGMSIYTTSSNRTIWFHYGE
jgi:hypothetical protein